VHKHVLSVIDVSVRYGTGHAAVQALSDVTLDLHLEQMTLVMGPSGSGKTTLLSVLGCLLTPDKGEVSVMGQKVTDLSENKKGEVRRKNIGYVFQAFRLFHSLSAVENVAIAMELSRRPRRQSKELACHKLEAMGLADKLRLRPHELSGGEKQRVAIARALINDPPILLGDEPTASLDSKSGSQIAEMLLKVAEEQKRAVVVVSHDPRLLQYAHRVVKVEDGRLIEDKELR